MEQMYEHFYDLMDQDLYDLQQWHDIWTDEIIMHLRRRRGYLLGMQFYRKYQEHRADHRQCQ